MTQETAKIKLSNEEDTLESIAIAFGSPMVSEEFRAEVGHILEKSEKYHGIFTLSDYPVSTDKLSVEKLQEQLNTAKKALTEIGSGTWHSRDRGLVVDTSDGETVSLFTLTDQALAAIGGDDE